MLKYKYQTGHNKAIKVRLVIALSILLIFLFAASFATHYLSALQLGQDAFKNWFPRFYSLVFWAVAHVFVWALIGLAIFYLAYVLLFFRLHWTKNYSLALVSILIAFGIAEGTLRLLGFEAGYYENSQHFRFVKEVKDYGVYAVDENGVTHFSDKVRNFICCDSAMETQGDYVLSMKTQSGFLEYLLEKDSTAGGKQFILRNDLDSALLEYMKAGVNADGFKSLPFKQYSTRKPKVLLLGDSFTWGYSSSNVYNAFADQLLAKGYIVFNTGLSGADPAQYLEVARKYIPILKPDVVVVNFYLGNDVIYYKRNTKVNIPFVYTLNAGYLNSFQDGKYLKTPKEAYEAVKQGFRIDCSGDWYSRVCSKTVITTLLWGGLHADKYSARPCLPGSAIAPLDTPACNAEVREIKDLCNEYKLNFVLAVIPDRVADTLTQVSSFKNLFPGEGYYYPPLTADDYLGNMQHLNDKGYHNYALFLDSILSKELKIWERFKP